MEMLLSTLLCIACKVAKTNRKCVDCHAPTCLACGFLTAGRWLCVNCAVNAEGEDSAPAPQAKRTHVEPAARVAARMITFAFVELLQGPACSTDGTVTLYSNVDPAHKLPGTVVYLCYAPDAHDASRRFYASDASRIPRELQRSWRGEGKAPTRYAVAYSADVADANRNVYSSAKLAYRSDNAVNASNARMGSYLGKL